MFVELSLILKTTFLSTSLLLSTISAKSVYSVFPIIPLKRASVLTGHLSILATITLNRN